MIKSQNVLNNFGSFELVEKPDLMFRIKQNVIQDMDLFSILIAFIKLITKKLYNSLDLSQVFGIKMDNEKKGRHRNRFRSNSKLKRLLFGSKTNWKMLRNTPQFIAIQSVDKLLGMSLELLYFGVKNNPVNVSMVSVHSKDIYYLMSFNPEICFKILLEVAKFSTDVEDSLVSFH